MSRDDAALLDILRYCERARRAANGRRVEELARNEALQSLLIHPLLVIGEAVKSLSANFRERHNQIRGHKSLECGIGSFMATSELIGKWSGKR
jgi:uncharacterized protein with HEPN domain